MPRKIPLPVTIPTVIKLPGSVEALTRIEADSGKHIVECDLCHSLITLTVNAHPRAFFTHRGGSVCLQNMRNSGLSMPAPLTVPPQISVTRTSGVQEIDCPGLSLQWLPGSVWETYPYHQHEIAAIGWRPVSFGKEDNEIFLRSDDCHGKILSTDEPPCKECRILEYSSRLRVFMDCANEAKPHTPWELLTLAQTRALLQKMATKIQDLRTKVLLVISANLTSNWLDTKLFIPLVIAKQHRKTYTCLIIKDRQSHTIHDASWNS